MGERDWFEWRVRRDLDGFDLDDRVEAVVLDVVMDFSGSTGIAVRMSDGVMNKISPAHTAYDVVLVSSSMADDIMWTTWPLASAMVPGRNIDSCDDKRLVIA